MAEWTFRMSIPSRIGEALWSENLAETLRCGSLSILDFTCNYIANLYPSRHIFDAEWDIMLILDACRYDLMNEIAPEFSYLPNVGKAGSVGSKTTEWMEKTFTTAYEPEMANTAYITGNPNSAKYLNPEDFAMLDEVWRYAWDDKIGTMPMEPLTDRAITVGRTRNISRLLVHYMQPHEPFLSAPTLGGSDTVERITGKADTNNFRSVWSRLENGELSKKTVWKHYQENLRRVLENIELLINNFDAHTVIITSDHGNALGELRLYGHPPCRPIPSLRRVPWIELSATDMKTYEPEDWEQRETNDVDSRLRDLGYL